MHCIKASLIEAFAWILDLDDAAQRRAPGREADVVYLESDLGQPIVEDRLVA